MMKNRLRISNLIATGRLPTNNKINFDNIIKNSKYLWAIPTPENSTPICSVRFNRGDGMNVNKKKKTIYISLWTSGAINICGLKSLKEGKKYFDLIVEELQRIGELK